MIYMNSSRRPVLRRSGSFFRLDPGPSAVFGFTLILGITVGTLFGLFSTHAAELSLLSASGVQPSLLISLWHCSAFLLAALLLSTSYLGIIILPLLTLLRGFSLGCSVAALYSAQALHGLLYALFVLGLPALFELPALLLLSGECIRLSALRLPRGIVLPAQLLTERTDRRVLLLCAVLTAAGFAYARFLMPLLLQTIA